MRKDSRLGRLFQIILLVEFVVQRFETDAEFFSCFRLIALVALESLVDRLHFQIAQTDHSAP